MDDLVQILLNTLEPNTQIVREAQKKLESCYSHPEYPVMLGQIICDYQNHPKQLDLVAVVSLSKTIKYNYAGHNPDVQAQICEVLLKVFDLIENRKVINSLILIFRQIVIIDYPNGTAFQVILNNFNEEQFNQMTNPFRKFIFLKLLYKCILGIHSEKLKTPETLEQFRNLLNAKTNTLLSSLIGQLLRDLSQLSIQLKTDSTSPEVLEPLLSQIFAQLSDNFFFDTAKYIFKIYSMKSLISKYTPLGDFNVVVMARNFHMIYKLIVSHMINSGLIQKVTSSKEIENILGLIYVTEKHLMSSIEQKILEAEDTWPIFEHLLTVYFSNKDQLAFFGEKFVDFNQLLDNKYLSKVCDTDIYLKLKFHEEKLLINCLNVLSSLLVNFSSPNGYDEEGNGQGKSNFIATTFNNHLELILTKIFDQILFIDVKDLKTLKSDPEDYYTELLQADDPDVNLRVAAKALLEHMGEYLDESILGKLAHRVQEQIVNFNIDNVKEFKEILKRESNYFFLTKLYGKLKNDIDYNELIPQCLAADLNIQEKSYDIVKIQVLLLAQSHVEREYTLQEESSKKIFEAVYTLISQSKSTNLCIIIISLKILIHLLETNALFLTFVPEIAAPIFELSKQVTNIDSKLAFYEFFEYSIIGNIPQYYSMIWEICQEEYQSLRDTASATINLKSKIIGILIKLITEMGEIDHSKVPFLLAILEEAIQDHEYSEELLLQDGFHLIGKLLTKMNLHQLSEESILKVVNLVNIICAIAMKNLDFVFMTILILENCLLSGIPIVVQTIGKNLGDFLPIWFTDFKDTALKYFFDLAEIYLRVDKVNRNEFAVFVMEKSLFYMKTSNEVNKINLVCMLRFLARLAFEDSEVFLSVLGVVSAKLEMNDCKFKLLSDFYGLIKEESNDYYANKNFCFYTLTVMSIYLKELEATEGVDINKCTVSDDNIFKTDFKQILEVFCQTLSALYKADSNEEDRFSPEIVVNTQNLIYTDDHLQANEFELAAFEHFVTFIMHDPMWTFDIYSQAKDMFEKSSYILGDNECKSIVTNNINF